MLPILFFQRICELNHKKLCVSVKNINIFENINIFFVCFFEIAILGTTTTEKPKTNTNSQTFRIRRTIIFDSICNCERFSPFAESAHLWDRSIFIFCFCFMCFHRTKRRPHSSSTTPTKALSPTKEPTLTTAALTPPKELTLTAMALTTRRIPMRTISISFEFWQLQSQANGQRNPLFCTKNSTETSFFFVF